MLYKILNISNHNKAMGKIGTFIGMSLGLISGILTFIFYLLSLTSWLGILGTILAFAFAPGVVIFPIIFWIVEGIFPTFYFVLWGIGWVGTIIFAVSWKKN